MRDDTCSDGSDQGVHQELQRVIPGTDDQHDPQRFSSDETGVQFSGLNQTQIMNT